jgi:hypothetical protein
MGWTQEQGRRELSAWFWRHSKDGISQLEVHQKLGPEGEEGPWQIWFQTGILNRGPISLREFHLVNTFEAPRDAIAIADLLDENDFDSARVHNIIQSSNLSSPHGLD